ncbi:MAG: protein kinase [Puniceicoccales bacterium]|nr:protein kinase [Puniceicoccales bacterium]
MDSVQMGPKAIEITDIFHGNVKSLHFLQPNVTPAITFHERDAEKFSVGTGSVSGKIYSGNVDNSQYRGKGEILGKFDDIVNKLNTDMRKCVGKEYPREVRGVLSELLSLMLNPIPANRPSMADVYAILTSLWLSDWAHGRYVVLTTDLPQDLSKFPRLSKLVDEEKKLIDREKKAYGEVRIKKQIRSLPNGFKAPTVSEAFLKYAKDTLKWPEEKLKFAQKIKGGDLEATNCYVLSYYEVESEKKRQESENRRSKSQAFSEAKAQCTAVTPSSVTLDNLRAGAHEMTVDELTTKAVEARVKANVEEQKLYESRSGTNFVDRIIPGKIAEFFNPKKKEIANSVEKLSQEADAWRQILLDKLKADDKNRNHTPDETEKQMEKRLLAPMYEKLFAARQRGLATAKIEEEKVSAKTDINGNPVFVTSGGTAAIYEAKVLGDTSGMEFILKVPKYSSNESGNTAAKESLIGEAKIGQNIRDSASIATGDGSLATKQALDDMVLPGIQGELHDGEKTIPFLLQERVRGPNAISAISSGLLETKSELGRTELYKKNSPEDPRRAIEIACKVAYALRALHAIGRVHGDIKLGNLMFDGDGNPLLIDFGTSLKYGEKALAFSPNAAPEVTFESQLEPSMDVWTFGTILLPLLFGKNSMKQVGFEGLSVSSIPWIFERSRDVNERSRDVNSAYLDWLLKISENF